MAVTPRHGSQAALAIDSTSGTLVTFSSGLDQVSLSMAMDAAEVTTLQDLWRSHVVGLRGATLSFAGPFSSTHAEIYDGIMGSTTSTSQSIEYSPDGSTASGRHLLKMEAILTSLEYSTPVDGRSEVSGEFLVTGAVTSTNH